MSRFAAIAVGPSKSSPVLRTRTLSTGFWLIFERSNKAALPYCTWCHPPEHPLSHYLFSQGANPQPQISKDATEKSVALTVACYRSEMDGYALCDHLGEQLFREIGGYFENFSGSVSRISEETYSQQAVYLSYTWNLSLQHLYNICGLFLCVSLS
jgi:hypothetical protein